MTRASLILAALLAIALPLSLLAGRIWLDPANTPNAVLILAELRLPRGVLAIVIGAGLGAIRLPIRASSGSLRGRRSVQWRRCGSAMRFRPGCYPLSR